MSTITINGVDYKISLEKIGPLVKWLEQNGAVKVLENNIPNLGGRTLINE